jgi:hypothetical protein
MHVGGKLKGSHQRAVGANINRYRSRLGATVGSQRLERHQRISSGLVYRHIARHRRQRPNRNPRVPNRHNNRDSIIARGIGINYEAGHSYNLRPIARLP